MNHRWALVAAGTLLSAGFLHTSSWAFAANADQARKQTKPAEIRGYDYSHAEMQNQVASVDRLISKWQQVLGCADERRARVQPCHIALAIMRASAPEVRLSPSFGANSARKEMISPLQLSKSVPQRLKPSSGRFLRHG
jgi:hypothetical protein